MTRVLFIFAIVLILNSDENISIKSQDKKRSAEVDENISIKSQDKKRSAEVDAKGQKRITIKKINSEQLLSLMYDCIQEDGDVKKGKWEYFDYLLRQLAKKDLDLAWDWLKKHRSGSVAVFLSEYFHKYGIDQSIQFCKTHYEDIPYLKPYQRADSDFLIESLFYGIAEDGDPSNNNLNYLLENSHLLATGETDSLFGSYILGLFGSDPSRSIDTLKYLSNQGVQVYIPLNSLSLVCDSGYTNEFANWAITNNRENVLDNFLFAWTREAPLEAIQWILNQQLLNEKEKESFIKKNFDVMGKDRWDKALDSIADPYERSKYQNLFEEDILSKP